MSLSPPLSLSLSLSLSCANSHGLFDRKMSCQEIEPTNGMIGIVYAFSRAYKKHFRNFPQGNVRKNFLSHKYFLIRKNHISDFCRLPNSLLRAGDIISARRDAELFA
jgi:hypothetical protein